MAGGRRVNSRRSIYSTSNNRATSVNSVDIIIVNWNSRGLLRECIKSIALVAGEVDLQRLVVVDNASTDGSIDGIDGLRIMSCRAPRNQSQSSARSHVESAVPVTVLRNDENVGYGRACNEGARGSTADYLLFLNPDTRLRPGALRVPATFLENTENAAVGIVGIQLVDERNHVLRTSTRLPSPGRAVAHALHLESLFPKLDRYVPAGNQHSSHEVEQVMGAFFFTRRLLFERLGGFDELFFVYMEEIDFSFRAREEGWSSWYLASAQAYHRGGGTTERVKHLRVFYFQRSRILYFFKHFGFFGGAGYLLFALSLAIPVRILHALPHGRFPWSTVRGHAMLWRDLPSILGRALRAATRRRNHSPDTLPPGKTKTASADPTRSR